MTGVGRDYFSFTKEPKIRLLSYATYLKSFHLFLKAIYLV